MGVLNVTDELRCISTENMDIADETNDWTGRNPFGHGQKLLAHMAVVRVVVRRVFDGEQMDGQQQAARCGGKHQAR